MWRSISNVRAFVAAIVMAALLGSSTAATNPIRHVLVVIAMEAEAMPFVEHLKLVKDDSVFRDNLPFVAYSGKYNGNHHKVTVVTNGKDAVHDTGVDNVGTVPAAMVTYLALEKLSSIDLVINAGTAGGFQRLGATIADVFLIHTVAHHDRRIPIPDFTPYGVGKLETKVEYERMAKELHFKTGACTTGNSLDATDTDHTHMLNNEASVKDMEAAAIAWSCELHNVPWMGLKVVTDIVDGDVATQEEFLANLAAASKSLQEALPKVLDYVCGKTHDEL